jgi:AmmeMemoRadiSam system protein A
VATGPGGPRLDAETGAALVALARARAVAAITGMPASLSEPANLPPALGDPGAAFVTLRVDGVLRGCLGRLEPGRESLAAVVAALAAAAATRDHRFAPIGPGEVARLEVEVSVLGPIEDVEDPGLILVGRDGLLVEAEGHSGLLLPQVPVEHGWDRETFLAQACRKAGLPPQAWRHGATLRRFDAQVFGGGAKRAS